MNFQPAVSSLLIKDVYSRDPYPVAIIRNSDALPKMPASGLGALDMSDKSVNENRAMQPS